MRLINRFDEFVRIPASLNFDSDVHNVRQNIIYWICNSEFNKARENVLRGAVAFRSLIDRKELRKETRHLSQALNALRKEIL